jgi:hypothetical protein
MSNAADRVSSRQPVDETLTWQMRRAIATDTSVLVFLTVALHKVPAALTSSLNGIAKANAAHDSR